MYIKKTKALRYAIALFLTIGTVLSTGFLSFSGLWVIYPYTIPAIFAFFLSGVIEGKVFGVSIFKGLARLKLLTSNADKHLLFWELNKYVEISSFQNKYTCDFLKDYCAQRKKYKALKNKSNVDGEDVKEAKKRLEELKTFFYQQLKEPEHTVTSYISKELREVSLHELKSAKKSVAFLRFFLGNQYYSWYCFRICNCFCSTRSHNSGFSMVIIGNGAFRYYMAGCFICSNRRNVFTLLCYD